MANLPATDYRELLRTGEFSDFTIICNHERIPVHKNIISQNSAYFATLVRSKFKEATEDAVEFNDIDCDVLKHLLDYFYCGTSEWNYPREDITMNVRLWILADRFQVYPAMIAVERNLVKNINCAERMAVAAQPDILELVFSHQANGMKISTMTTTFGFAAWMTSCVSSPETCRDMDAVVFDHPSLASIMLHYARRQIKSAKKYDWSSTNQIRSPPGFLSAADTYSRLFRFEQLPWGSPNTEVAVQEQIKGLWSNV